MRRRRFLQLGAASLGLAAGQQKPPTEKVTATATQLRTPRVGIVLSSFRGSTDPDKTVLPGLADPQPVDADLTAVQIDAMVRRAIEMGATVLGGLPVIVKPDDWVVIKPNIASCHGLGPESHDGGAHQRYIPGSVTDLRVVQSLIAWLVEHKRGQRITIAEGSPEWLPMERSKSPVDGWTSDWGGTFGGLTYKSMVAEFSRQHPSIRFELVDLNFDEAIEMPVPGNVWARHNPEGTYHLPKTIQQCDRVITVAPLKTHSAAGVSLAIGNYLGIAPGSKYGFPKAGLDKLGDPGEVAVDLFSYHPADYAILGGMWGVEGDGPSGPGAESVHHNLILAGADAVAVDAVGALVMGFNPADIEYLRLAERKGFGTFNLNSIWPRGNSIQEARRVFRKPAKFK